MGNVKTRQTNNPIRALRRPEKGTERTIISRVPHPLYDETSTSADYDFMIMQLDKSVTEVKPVTLNMDANVPATDDVLTVVGHGVTSEWGDASEALMEVKVDAVSDDVCKKQYEKIGEIINKDTMFCASREGKSCSGSNCVIIWIYL